MEEWINFSLEVLLPLWRAAASFLVVKIIMILSDWKAVAVRADPCEMYILG